MAEEGVERRWDRLLPKTAMAVAVTILLMGIASAFTGAVLYAYYEYQQNKTDKAVDEFVSSFDDRLDAAKALIDEQAADAKAEVQAQLDELERFSASGETLTSLLDKVNPSVWFVSTLDEAGQPSVGSAFVVFADDTTSYLLTSYNTVRAATVQPAPSVAVRKVDDELPATLVTWDPAHDLALLSVERPNLPRLEWAQGDPAASIGDRVFVVSGLGAAGGAISQGFVADVSADGVQHDAPVGAAYQGGPLLNSNGEVLGVASRAYSPLHFDPQAVFFAVPIRAACESVLRCPDGTATGAGG
jgi:putative serine protease PepD